MRVLFFTILVFVISGFSAPASAQNPLQNIQGIIGGAANDFGNWIAPLMRSAEQLTTSQQEEENSTLVDAELVEDTVTSGQESLVKLHINELQTDEVACEVTSLTVANAPAQMQQVQDDIQRLTAEISDEALGHTGSTGGLLPGEQTRVTAARIARRCSPDENNGNLKEICEAEESEDTNCHIRSETLLRGSVSPQCVSEYTQLLTQNMPQIPPALANNEEIQRAIATNVNALSTHKSLISNGLARIVAPGLPGPEGNNDQIRALLESVGASEELIAEYLPEEGGISEDAQFEVLTNFYLANPDFFTDLQMNEANIIRIRTMLEALSVRLDQKIVDMENLRVQHMSAIAGIDINENRRGTEADIISATVEQ